MREQGYDWFGLIGACECDGGPSGTGARKKIPIASIERALKLLETHDTKGHVDSTARKNRAMLAEHPELAVMIDRTDAFTCMKPVSQSFMNNCLEFCKKNACKHVIMTFA